MTNIIPLDKKNHKNYKIKPDKSYAHTKSQHIALIQVHEFVAAAIHYPIVFVKNAETGEFRSVVMLGLEPNENLFSQNNSWNAQYVPTSIKGYPFLITPDTMSLCINTESPLINENEGMSLFNDEGKETDFLKSTKQLLANFIAQTPVTESFIKHISSKKLISPFNISIEINKKQEKKYDLNGVYAIDNSKLQDLPDDEFLTLKKAGYLPAIYAHLTSLGTISRLAHIKSLSDI